MSSLDGHKVFISYSRTDQIQTNWLQRLNLHLGPLERHGVVLWDDTRIASGADWRHEIEMALEHARVAILLIGPGFLQSKFIAANELPPLLTAARERGLRIFPVYALHCAHDLTELSRFQSFNDPAQPLESLDSAKCNALLSELARRVHMALEDGPPKLPSEPVVIAVMGAKGGVGKGTFVSCVAQLFARAGQDVGIIDYDLETCGTTNDAYRRYGRNNDLVKTVYDHYSPYSQGFEGRETRQNEKLWAVTPEPIKKNYSGKIWLVPASEAHDDGSRWELIANLPVPREQRLIETTRAIIDRIRQQKPSICWILIDCGAGTNPIFSAAFAQARYGYILVTPDDSYFPEVQRILAAHKERYPNAELQRVSVVANMITSPADKVRVQAGLQKIHIAGFIPRNPILQEDQFRSPLDFELGYDDVTLAVRESIASSVSDEDRKLVPEEVDLQLQRWWNRLVRDRLATRILRSPPFRKRLSVWRIFAASTAACLLFLTTLVALGRFAPSEEERIGTLRWDYLGLVVLALLLGFSVWGWLKQERKRRLLERIELLSGAPNQQEQRTVLSSLMTEEPDRTSLRWLNNLMQGHIQENNAPQVHNLRLPKEASHAEGS